MRAGPFWLFSSTENEVGTGKEKKTIYDNATDKGNKGWGTQDRQVTKENGSNNLKLLQLQPSII